MIAASNNVKPIYLNGEEGNKNKQDPHAWLSLDNGIKYVKTIQKSLEHHDKKISLHMKSKGMHIYQN